MGGNGPMYKVAAVSSVGGMLKGLDIGLMSSVLVMDNFVSHFGVLSTLTTGVVVSMYVLGCFVSSLISGQTCDIFGRKRTILLGAVIFIIGSIVQSTSQIIEILSFGRFINGLGIGLLSMAVPTYQSEVSSPGIRGRLISLQQWAITWGILIAFWIAVAFNNIQGSNMQWRGPIAMQAIPAAILFGSMLLMPYSPRWLIYKDRYEEAITVLADLRSGGDRSDPRVLEEVEAIKEGIRISRENSTTSYSELFKYPIRRRLLLGVLVQAFQQMTGINVILYYAPSIFQDAGIGGANAAIYAHGINGVVNMLFTIPAILFVDKWGRRKTLMLGATGCGLSYLVITIATAASATVITLEDGSTEMSMGSPVATWLVIVSVYTFVASFAISWGPIGWIYPAEIFPMSKRAKGTSLTTASNFTLNFTIGLIAPTLLYNLLWGLYLMFFIFMAIAFTTVYFFFPETKGKSLEEMEIVFTGSIWAFKDSERVEREIAKIKEFA